MLTHKRIHEGGDPLRGKVLANQPLCSIPVEAWCGVADSWQMDTGYRDRGHCGQGLAWRGGRGQGLAWRGGCGQGLAWRGGHCEWVKGVCGNRWRGVEGCMW